MLREAKTREPDAWKRWLLEGAKLFDRTWSGWALLFWLFSLCIVYLASHTHHLIAVVIVVASSAAAFGAHIAVFDVLASGTRSRSSWLTAIAQDLRSNRRHYLRSAAVRTIVAAVSLLLLGGIIVAGGGLMGAEQDAEAASKTPIPFWKLWGVWAWAWLIPAGWQKCGALGWGHWLIRREGVPADEADNITSRGISLNIRSYVFIIAALMAPAMIFLMFFPPLLPVWDIYAAAVCWCIWDDVFGDGQGVKEMEARKTAQSLPAAAGV